MLNELKNELNETKTENMDKSYLSSTNSIVDFFALAGAMRDRDEQDIISLFLKAYNEDKQIAIRELFYFRDIRGGAGERRLFRVIIKYLANNEKDVCKQILKHIPEYGRWDDMFELFDTPLKDNVVQLTKEQFLKDVKSDKPTLLGKWMPSINTSSKKTREKAKVMLKVLDMKEKEYRKTLSALRLKIDIVEKKMSENKWGNINYSHTPSRAAMIYSDAFRKHDEERYNSFIESVKKGKKKINASVLYPYEIYESIKKGIDPSTINELWKALPDYINKDENALVMADVSDSMFGRPIAVSVSLALYFAERNKGKFANHFMTFSGRPDLVEVQGNTIQSKFNSISRAHWDMNTDVTKAFMTILNTAVKNNVPKSEMPNRLYIISDMQFDECCNMNKTSYEHAKDEYNKAGYELPEVVFWNVDARTTQVPAKNEKGVLLVSGLSPVLFKQILSGRTSLDLVLEIVNQDRYKDILIK